MKSKVNSHRVFCTFDQDEDHVVDSSELLWGLSLLDRHSICYKFETMWCNFGFHGHVKFGDLFTAVTSLCKGHLDKRGIYCLTKEIEERVDTKAYVHSSFRNMARRC